MAALMNGMSDTSSAVIVRYVSTPAADAAASTSSAGPRIHISLVAWASFSGSPSPANAACSRSSRHHEHRSIGRGPRDARGLGDDVDRHDLLLDLQLGRGDPLPVRHHHGEPVARCHR